MPTPRFPFAPSIDFAVKDPAVILQNLVNDYQTAYLAQNKVAKTLAPGDPVLLFLSTIANEFTLLRQLADYIGKSNTLNYAVSGFLDIIGLLYGPLGKRIQASPATCTIQFTLSLASTVDITVPAGTIVAASGSQSVQFATITNLTIPAGALTGTVSAQAVTSGTVGNGYVAGQINQVVVFNTPLLQGAQNTTTTSGGFDVETDDGYAARLYLIPASYATTGTLGAYLVQTYSSNDDVQNAIAWTPGACQVGVSILMNGNAQPTTSQIALVQSIIGNTKVRNLTDYVTTYGSGQVTMNVAGQFWIAPEDQAQATNIEQAVQNAILAYIAYVTGQIARNIDPGKLSQMMYDAGASRVVLTSPTYTMLSNGFNSGGVGQANTPDYFSIVSSVTIPAIGSSVNLVSQLAGIAVPLNVGDYICIGDLNFQITATGASLAANNLGTPNLVGLQPTNVIAALQPCTVWPQIAVLGTNSVTYAGLDTSN